MEEIEEATGGEGAGEEEVTPDILLVGCVKGKLEWASRVAARKLYASPLWRSRRAYAEQAGRPWFILSAKYGLLHPEERIAWYDLDLSGLPAAERRTWSAGGGRCARGAISPDRGQGRRDPRRERLSGLRRGVGAAGSGGDRAAPAPRHPDRPPPRVVSRAGGWRVDTDARAFFIRSRSEVWPLERTDIEPARRLSARYPGLDARDLVNPACSFTYRAASRCVANHTPSCPFMYRISSSSTTIRDRCPITCGCMVRRNIVPSA